MESQIYGALPSNGHYKKITIFGYSSKGLPGIEINGVGNFGNLIKQKFIYLTRICGLKIPLKRYHLCIEGNDKRDEDLKNLELPILILFLTLGEQLPLTNLYDCVACGVVNISGILHHQTIPDPELSTLLCDGLDYLKYIYPREYSSDFNCRVLCSTEIFAHIPGLKVTF